MDDRAQDNPGAWAKRPGASDGEPIGVTSGLLAGPNGARLALRGWLAVAALVTLAAGVNVMTRLDDGHARGVVIPLWLPLVLEFSSAVAALATAPLIIPPAVAFAPPGRGPLWRTLGVHIVASLVFSIAHVALMTLIRLAVFAAIRQPFAIHLAEWPYEYRKDLVTYVVVAGIIWALSRPPRIAPAVRQTAAAPITFDIRDSGAILRVPVGEILAAQAAGNYVEFALADGRRPLMRASMAQIETALATAGFVRTHRSWLVNAAGVRALVPVGSGDFRVELASGLSAPLSRRYPAALALLRGD
jgi:DNA-binding LytR/AlgR family response regulator